MTAITTQPRITKISRNAYDLIKHFEGLRLSAYQCQAGKWTIGIGTTRYPDGRLVRKGDRVLEPAAIVLFNQTVRPREIAVDNLTRDDITQNEFDALVALTYNIGQEALATSTVLRLVNGYEQDRDKLLKAFLMWDNVHIDGKLVHSDGLERRRRSEWHLFTRNELFFYEANKI